MAALELLEESIHGEELERVRRIAEQSADPEAVLAAGAPRRSLAAGYYLWLVEYLVPLEAQMAAGVTIPEARIAAADLEGLAALKAAREEFDRKHPQCRCGKRLANEWEKQCAECMAKAA
jgi:hypothetical protein